MNPQPMILGALLGNNFGVHPGAWRLPGIDPTSYTSIEATLTQARAAERGGFEFIFLADRLYMYGDLTTSAPRFNMDPIITMASIAQGTERIGLVGTASSSFTEPYLLARQLKALDVISHGRVGWNAVPSYELEAFANFGRKLPARENKYERLHEVVQIVQALWGSWGLEAGEPDQAGMFADPSHIRPVNLQGRHVGARGPLPVPPSAQGQPVIVMPASSGYGLQAAGMYADVVIGMPLSIAEGQAQRQAVRQAATSAGREPDDVKYLAFAGFTIGSTEQEALDMHRTLDDLTNLEGPLAQLRALLGLSENFEQLNMPLPSAQRAKMRVHPQDARSARAAKLVQEGWSPHDILAHGVLDPYPTVVGTGVQAADLLQEWFEAGAADGFMACFDDFHTGIDAFVDHALPVLSDRGLFSSQYHGTTLRENLRLPKRYGLDPRVS